LPEIVPGPAPAREDGPAGGRLFLVGVAASLLLHGLIVLLFIETPAREMQAADPAEAVEVVLVPPPPAEEAQEPEEEAAPEPEAPPEPEEEPEDEPEQEEEAPAPEPQPQPEPEPEPQPEPETPPAPVPDADSLPVLQPVEEFAEDASEAAGGEDGEPRDGTSLPEEEPRPDEPVGEDGEAEDAQVPETEPADADAPAADPAEGPVSEETAVGTPAETETETGTEADPSAAEEPSPEDAAADEALEDEAPAEDETQTQDAPEQAIEDGASESDIVAGPEAEGETAPVGETAVEEAPRSAPETEGLTGAIATTLPRAKPTPPPLAALGEAVEGDLPPGVRLPAPATEPARRPGAPQLGRARELFSDRILGDSRTRTAMAGMSGPQRLNLLCLTELRAQIRDLYPDRPAEILPSFRPQPGTVLAPVRAAYRSRGVWYDLDFRCETDPAVTRVEDFSFRVGPPVPRSQWRSRGFPQN
jgi:hypothetical protein